MSAAPALPSGYGIFCDDVRTEASGKETIVGTYNGEMVIVGEFPARVLLLNASIRLYDNPQSFPKKLVFRVTRTTASGAVDVLSVAEIDAKEAPPPPVDETNSLTMGTKFAVAGVTMRMENLEFNEPCRLRIIADVDGREIWLNALGVRAVPLAEIAFE